MPDKKDLLQLDTRRGIYDFIQRCPGTHLRGVEREMGLPFGQVLYHLDHLERNGLVVTRKDGGFKRYFASNQVGRKEKAYLSAFRHEVPRKIAVLLLLTPDRSHHGILDYFEITGSTLSFHLNKMVEAGIVARRQEGNENYYRLADERMAAKTLVMYRESFHDPAVDRFTEVWLNTNYLSPNERLEALSVDPVALGRMRGSGTHASPADVAESVLNG